MFLGFYCSISTCENPSPVRTVPTNLFANRTHRERYQPRTELLQPWGCPELRPELVGAAGVGSDSEHQAWDQKYIKSIFIWRFLTGFVE